MQKKKILTWNYYRRCQVNKLTLLTITVSYKPKYICINVRKVLLVVWWNCDCLRHKSKSDIAPWKCLFSCRKIYLASHPSFSLRSLPRGGVSDLVPSDYHLVVRWPNPISVEASSNTALSYARNCRKLFLFVPSLIYFVKGTKAFNPEMVVLDSCMKHEQLFFRIIDRKNI